MLYPIIIAGGQGTRLWPVSRKASPKQVKPFLGDKTLLNKTFERMAFFVDKQNIFLATTKSLYESAKREVPGMPEENILAEPVRRDTAAALGMAVFKLYKKDKDATFVYINSDNYIKNESKFKEILETGEKFIAENSNKVLLVGVKPSYPETGYGYIKTEKLVKSCDGFDIFEVDRFVEKPNIEKATEYLSSGDYFWNPTLIIAKAEHFINLYKKHLPEMYNILLEISNYFGSIQENDKIEELFQKIDPISIDYGILEKERDMLVLPADFGWMDVGHWKAIWEMLSNEEGDNVALCEHIHLDSRGNLVYSENDKIISTIGLRDMLVVDTADALMICPKDRAQDVKRIVNILKEKGKEKFL